MAGIDEVQLRAEDDYAFEGDIADDSQFVLPILLASRGVAVARYAAVDSLKARVTKKKGRGFGGQFAFDPHART